MSDRTQGAPLTRARIRPLSVALLALAAVSDPAGAAGAGSHPVPPAAPSAAVGGSDPAGPVLTAKERLGGKARDEQRLNDCKVPEPARTRPRPVCSERSDDRAARP